MLSFFVDFGQWIRYIDITFGLVNSGEACMNARGLDARRGDVRVAVFTALLCVLLADGCRRKEAEATPVPDADSTRADMKEYLVIDLSGGVKAKQYPVHYSSVPPDLNNDVCRTTELWLRLIPAGTFTMGSPSTELGQQDNEAPHQVTLTNPFYMGIFEVTQKQYLLVMGGTNPSKSKGDTRPVEKVGYDMLRGSSAGSKWPADNEVDAESFFGRLREKTNIRADLPTEAQWEYACRAGTATALNSGQDLTEGLCPNMAETGRYAGNADDAKWGYSGKHTKVGMYLPNAYGLYDMHGNVREWCLDWYGSYAAGAVANPKGPLSGDGRIQRGGDYSSPAPACRSAHRARSYPYSNDDATGFRVCVPLSL